MLSKSYYYTENLIWTQNKRRYYIYFNRWSSLLMQVVEYYYSWGP